MVCTGLALISSRDELAGEHSANGRADDLPDSARSVSHRCACKCNRFVRYNAFYACAHRAWPG